MSIVIQLRYSIILRERNECTPLDFKIAKGDEFENYKRKLFAVERLNVHENLLLNLTLPSLRAQVGGIDPAEVRLFIYISNLMPKCYVDRLMRETAGDAWIEVIEVDPGTPPEFAVDAARFVEETAPAGREAHVPVATVRLDDDDGLCSTFLRRLKAYVKPEFSGMCVSFSKGYLATYEPERAKLKNFIDYEYPKNAQGLAYVNSYDLTSKRWKCMPATVLDLGNHLKVDEKVPVICDAQEPSYLLVHHNMCDSYKDRYLQKLFKDAVFLDPSGFREKIDIASNLL